MGGDAPDRTPVIASGAVRGSRSRPTPTSSRPGVVRGAVTTGTPKGTGRIRAARAAVPGKPSRPDR